MATSGTTAIESVVQERQYDQVDREKVLFLSLILLLFIIEKVLSDPRMQSVFVHVIAVLSMMDLQICN